MPFRCSYPPFYKKIHDLRYQRTISKIRTNLPMRKLPKHYNIEICNFAIRSWFTPFTNQPLTNTIMKAFPFPSLTKMARVAFREKGEGSPMVIESLGRKKGRGIKKKRKKEKMKPFNIKLEEIKRDLWRVIPLTLDYHLSVWPALEST